VATRSHCARIATLLRWQNISLRALIISRLLYKVVNMLKGMLNYQKQMLHRIHNTTKCSILKTAVSEGYLFVSCSA
jgi:hypothetical protein